jgi:branched-chain amino acid aminotransferase
MFECFGNKFIINGDVQPAVLFSNTLVYEGASVYEVIRMVRGNPVFFYDHMERLETSVRLQRKKQLADINEIRKSIITLTRSDKRKETNLKIVFNYNKGRENYLVYFIEPIYPSEEQYRTGVKGILYKAERNNPESKVISHKLRSSIYHKLILESGYEALLVNGDNCITEGSRSNIFFLKGDTLVTAPDNVILNGITRKYILELCRVNGINVEFACVNVNDIGRYNSVFMTGTSPVVLPFYCINETRFDVSMSLNNRLRQLYLQKARESIREFRSEKNDRP